MCAVCVYFVATPPPPTTTTTTSTTVTTTTVECSLFARNNERQAPLCMFHSSFAYDCIHVLRTYDVCLCTHTIALVRPQTNIFTITLATKNMCDDSEWDDMCTEKWPIVTMRSSTEKKKIQNFCGDHFREMPTRNANKGDMKINIHSNIFVLHYVSFALCPLSVRMSRLREWKCTVFSGITNSWLVRWCAKTRHAICAVHIFPIDFLSNQ